MHLSWPDYIIITFFILLSLYIGLRYKKSAEGGLADFFLGGRSLPWYIAGLSMVATTFAADTPLAVSEFAATTGISGNWLWWSALIGGMLTTFFFAKLWRRANILTELEFIELRYSGIQAKILRGFKSVYLGLFMNALVIGWVNLAFMTLLEVFFDVKGWEAFLYTAITMAIALLYTSVSGLLGVAVNDAIQFFVAMIGTIALAFIVVNSDEVGGIENMVNKLPENYLNFLPEIGTTNQIGTTDVFAIFSISIGAFLTFVTLQWWASWYPGAEPGGGGYIAQRMMSAKTEQDAQRATLFFQVAHYCIRPWPWILVGLAAVLLYDPRFTITDNSLLEQIMYAKENGIPMSELITSLGATSNEVLRSIDYLYNPRKGYVFAMIDFLPTGLKGLLLVAFLAAYLSTISTQLNMGASFLMNDFFMLFAKKNKQFTNSDQITYSRLFTVIIMFAGIIITFFMGSISGVWSLLMETGAGLGGVLILRWFWWRVNAWSEIAAMLAPIAGYFLSHYLLNSLWPVWFEEHSGHYVFTVAFTSLCWVTATFLTKPEEKADLDAFCKRINPPGWWQGRNKSQNSNVFVLQWLLSVIGTYSLLFFIGSIFFKTIELTITLGIVTFIAFFLVFKSLQKQERLPKMGLNK